MPISLWFRWWCHQCSLGLWEPENPWCVAVRVQLSRGNHSMFLSFSAREERKGKWGFSSSWHVFLEVQGGRSPYAAVMWCCGLELPSRLYIHSACTQSLAFTSGSSARPAHSVKIQIRHVSPGLMPFPFWCGQNINKASHACMAIWVL